jgi:hypothetical protein
VVQVLRPDFDHHTEVIENMAIATVCKSGVTRLLAFGAVAGLLVLGACKQLSDFDAIGKSGTAASQKLADFYSQLEDTTTRTLELTYFQDGLRGTTGDSIYAAFRTRVSELEKRRAFAVKMAAMYTSFSTLVSTNDQANIESSVKDVSSSLSSMKLINASSGTQDLITSLLSQLDGLVREKKAEAIAPHLKVLNDTVIKFLSSESNAYEAFNQQYVDELRNVGQALVKDQSADPEPLLDEELTVLGLAPIKGKPLSAAAMNGYNNLIAFKGQEIAANMRSAFGQIQGAFTALAQSYADLDTGKSITLSTIEGYIQQAESYLNIVSNLKSKGASNGNGTNNSSK